MTDPVSPTTSASLPDLDRMAQTLTKRTLDPVEGVRALGQEARSGEFSKDDSRYIYIRGYGTTSANDAKPVLGTNGAGPCLIVALHNPAQKTAMLAHIDANTDIQSLHKLIQDMGGGSQPLTAHLAGGQDITRGMVGGVIDILKGYDKLQIKSADILNDTGLKSLAIDSRSGEVYTNFMSVNMDKGPNHSAIMGLHASTAMERLPLRPDYVDGQPYIVPAPQAAPAAVPAGR